MLKEKYKLIAQIKMVLDAIVISMSFFGAYFLSLKIRDVYQLDLFPGVRIIRTPGGTMLEYVPIVFLWVFLWILMLSVSGLYRSFRTRSFREIIWIIIKAAFLTVLSFGGLSFLLKIQFVSRVVFGQFMLLSTILLIAEKRVWVSVANYSRRQGHNLSKLLIVGTGNRAETFINMIKK